MAVVVINCRLAVQTIHWLRYGVVPVGVTEGIAPAAKLEKLRERSRLLYGYDRVGGAQTSAPFGNLSHLARRLLEAMVSACARAGPPPPLPTPLTPTTTTIQTHRLIGMSSRENHQDFITINFVYICDLSIHAAGMYLV